VYVPLGHAVQAAADVLPYALTLPISQGWQLATLLEPTNALNVPLGHSTHAEAPAKVYVPLGHSVQVEAPLADTLPASQSWQLVELEEPTNEEKYPAAQFAQAATPVVSLNLPATHSSHSSPGARKVHDTPTSYS
jgi:hypothetical protein